MSTIAKAAAVLSTNNQQFYKGLDDARAKLDGLSKHIESKQPKLNKPDTKGWSAGFTAFVGGIGGALATQFSNALSGGINGKLVGGVVGGAVGGAIGLIGGPIGALGGAVAGGLLGSITDTLAGGIVQLGSEIDQGLALGFGSEAFTGLSAGFADFGLEGQKVLGLFETLNDNAAKFGITGSTVEERFFNAAEAVKNAGSEAERTALATQLFGNSATRILPVLAQGSEALRQMIKDKVELGQALSQDDAAKLMGAKEAINNISDSLQGLWRRILVAASPVIEFVSQGISEWVLWLSKSVDWQGVVTEAFKFVATAAGYFVDAVMFLGEVAPVVFKAVTEALGFVGTTVSDVFTAFWDAIKVTIELVQELIQQLIKVGTQGMGKLGAGIVGALTAPLTALGKALGVDVATDFAKTLGEGIKLPKLFKDQDWTKITEAFGKIGNTGKGWVEQFDKLANRKWDKGPIGVLPQLKVEQPKPIQVQPVAAALEGSKEAASIEARFRFQGLIAPKQDQQLAEQKKANNILNDIKEGIQALAGAKGVEFGIV